MNETQKQVINSRLNEILMLNNNKQLQKKELMVLINYFYNVGKEDGKEELFQYMKTLL